MLKYTASAVTKNQSEKKINSLLDFMSACPEARLLQSFYEITLESQNCTANERLWFKTNMKLAKLWFDKQEFHRLQRILRELHRWWHAKRTPQFVVAREAVV